LKNWSLASTHYCMAADPDMMAEYLQLPVIREHRYREPALAPVPIVAQRPRPTAKGWTQIPKAAPSDTTSAAATPKPKARNVTAVPISTPRVPAGPASSSAGEASTAPPPSSPDFVVVGEAEDAPLPLTSLVWPAFGAFQTHMLNPFIEDHDATRNAIKLEIARCILSGCAANDIYMAMVQLPVVKSLWPSAEAVQQAVQEKALLHSQGLLTKHTY